MNYETRKRMVSNWLFDFLKNYEVPPHLDQDASKKELINMVEDINSEIPLLKENSFKLLLENVAKHIRKNQTSRRWPTIAFFIKAVKEHREKAMNDMAKETLPSPSHIEKIDWIVQRAIDDSGRKIDEMKRIMGHVGLDLDMFTLGENVEMSISTGEEEGRVVEEFTDLLENHLPLNKLNMFRQVAGNMSFTLAPNFKGRSI